MIWLFNQRRRYWLRRRDQAERQLKQLAVQRDARTDGQADD